MRNIMLFLVLIFVAVLGYQLASPYLISQGVDMNVTATTDTDVEKH
jgi:hypothetical protein